MTQPGTFADLLRRSRGDRTITEVANATNVKRPNLSCMERGTRYPSEPALARLCEYFNLSFDITAAMIAREKAKVPRIADVAEEAAD